MRFRDTVYGWIGAKRISGLRVGRLWKFKRDEVDGLVKSGGAEGRHGTEPGAHDSQ
jgi:excisionase family DNA binding protein